MNILLHRKAKRFHWSDSGLNLTLCGLLPSHRAEYRYWPSVWHVPLCVNCLRAGKRRDGEDNKQRRRRRGEGK